MTQEIKPSASRLAEVYLLALHDANKGDVMQSEEIEIFSERALDAIFQGDVIPQLRKDRTVEHYRARGFRYESAEAKAAGCSIIEASRVVTDNKGIYRARVDVRGVERDQSKSGFFPASWTRAEVIAAILEAYANRAAVGATERLYRGTGRGVAILLYLDKQDRVVDAMPVRRKVSARRAAVYQFEQTGKRSKMLCSNCDKAKVRLCPDCHSSNKNLSVFKRVKKLMRRVFGVLR
jgi:hypothetical protein